MPGDPQRAARGHLGPTPGTPGDGDRASRRTTSACASPTRPRTGCRSPSRRATTRTRYELLRALHRGRRLGRARQPPADAERQDRPQQLRRRSPPTTSAATTTGPTATTPTRERIFQDHVTYQQGLLWFLANDPRVPHEIRAGGARVGPAARRVPRDRRLAAPALRPRGAADGRPIRDDRARLPRRRPPPRTRSAWPPTHGLAQLPAASWSAASVLQRGRRAGRRPAPYPSPTARSCPRDGGVREPARAGLPVGLAHRVRLDPDGAGVHGARPVGGHRGVAGDRRGRGGAGRRLPGAAPAVAARRRVLAWPPPSPA